MLQSGLASKKKLDTIFKKFDQGARDYLILEEDLGYFENDFKKVLDKIPTALAENRYGSDRTSAFVNAIVDRVPKIYTRMLDDHFKNVKSVEKAMQKDKKKKVGEIDLDISDLK